MQNAQNTDIQQRVINLVELYRTKVGKESRIAKDAIDEKAYWDEANYNAAIHLYEEGFRGPIGIDMSPEIPAEEQNKFRVNEQLLGHFYSIVAGKNANERVLQQLLPNYYVPTVFSPEEEAFLRKHFKEMVNYIVKTPTFDLSELGMWTLELNDFLIPDEILELISRRVEIPAGSLVYNPFACLAQFPVLFEDCKFFCEESYVNWVKQRHEDKSLILWAWMTVAIFANKNDAVIIEDGHVPSIYDAVLSFIPSIPHAVLNGEYDNESGIYDSDIVSKIIESYKHLRKGGKMCLLVKTKEIDERNVFLPLKEFWQHLLSEGEIEEIIQLPFVIDNVSGDDFCIIIVEKDRKAASTTMIDARFAFQDKEQLDENLQTEPLKTFSNKAFSDMLKNDGKDPVTGLRKLVHIENSILRANLLAPNVYVVEKPSDEENPVPLSSICNLVSAMVRDVQFDLPEDTPWIKMSDLTPLFTGDMNMSDLSKADCPNNPPFTEGSNDYYFDHGEFVDNMWVQIGTAKGYHVFKYRQSTFLDGNTDAVLYECSEKHGGRGAVVSATGKPYAVSSGILVFCPKNSLDVYSLAALLRLPIVYRQLQAYHKYGIGVHLDDILVPTDKRIIFEEKLRMQKEQNVISIFKEELANKKKSLRMRKHALTQSLSSVKAMFVALNTYRKRKDGHLNDQDFISRIQGTTVQDAFEFIHKGIFEMMPALEHIADVEYSFSEAKKFDPEEFMEEFIAKEEKGWLNFKPVITWKKGNNKAKTNIYDEDGHIVIAKGKPLNEIIFPKDALKKIFENIISNAKSYAFTDDARKDYQLKFSWHTKGTVLIIEIENNGTPIPEDRDTTSLLKYGVSTALHHDGHNGIGCNEIDSIMSQYNGKVSIVSTPKELFTVKYVLTFNNSNI